LIHIVPETGSTNADLAARVRAGDALSEGYWLVADRQTGGRGRQGRAWEGGTGNFMGSTLVRIGQADPPAQTLAFLAGLAVIEALRPYCDGLRLKWPNDVLLGGAKLAGILLEAQKRPDGRHAIVIGIGVNVVAAPEGLPYPATSLAALGVARTAEAVFKALSDAWVDCFSLWRDGQGIAGVLAEWRKSAAGIGAPVAVSLSDGVVRGTFETVDEAGRLLLRGDDRSLITITAGDVHFGATATASP
jgi:BirA family biotin operon repressor/biotin-[acetyl-CoA-carboxylase] ligase